MATPRIDLDGAVVLVTGAGGGIGGAGEDPGGRPGGGRRRGTADHMKLANRADIDSSQVSHP